jgi:hypothetical protein
MQLEELVLAVRKTPEGKYQVIVGGTAQEEVTHVTTAVKMLREEAKTALSDYSTAGVK